MGGRGARAGAGEGATPPRRRCDASADRSRIDVCVALGRAAQCHGEVGFLLL